jgi:hypothetical protein
MRRRSGLRPLATFPSVSGRVPLSTLRMSSTLRLLLPEG